MYLQKYLILKNLYNIRTMDNPHFDLDEFISDNYYIIQKNEIFKESMNDSPLNSQPLHDPRSPRNLSNIETFKELSKETPPTPPTPPSSPISLTPPSTPTSSPSTSPPPIDIKHAMDTQINSDKFKNIFIKAKKLSARIKIKRNAKSHIL